MSNNKNCVSIPKLVAALNAPLREVDLKAMARGVDPINQVRPEQSGSLSRLASSAPLVCTMYRHVKFLALAYWRQT